MLYRVMTEVLDGAAGWMSVLLILSLDLFRQFSVKIISHPLNLLLGSCAIWACRPHCLGTRC